MNSILSGDMCLELKGVERSEAGLQGCASSRDCTLHCLASAEKLPLICIRGTRGIGKTHQLMQMGQLLTSQKGERAIYVNLNHFYFSSHTIYHFAKGFYHEGGRILLLDQVFKYPGWARELIQCRKELPELIIVFTASSVMTLEEEYPELKGEMKICDLHGFSYREYLNNHYNLSLPTVTIDQIFSDYQSVENMVRRQVDPWLALDGYISKGYYPHREEAVLFAEDLAKNMNMLLEVDLVYIRQIAPTYLPKLRKLLYLVSGQRDGVTNVSSLSEAIDTSRATVMNYLKYLSDARLIRLIYKEGGEYPKKPDRVFLNDTNILRVIREEEPQPLLEAKTLFLASVLDAGLEVNLADESGVDFVINGKLPVRFICKGVRRRSTPSDTLNILCSDEVNGDIVGVPIWMFGLLY